MSEKNQPAVDLPEANLEDLEELNEKDEAELSDAEVTSKIKLSVKRRFDFPTWMTVFEFQNAEGRRADCLALNTVESRNYPLVGMEFKASRNDWLAEKKDHEKADYNVRLCDEWYVVAGRRGIINESELPEGWGLLELKPSGQLWKLQDSDLSHVSGTDPDRRFYAKFMKKALGNESNFSLSDIREAQRRGYDSAMDEAVDEHLDYETEKLHDKAQAFDKLADSPLHLYPPVRDDEIERLKRAKKIVELVEEDRYSSILATLQALDRSLMREFENMSNSSNELQEHIEAIRLSLDDDGDLDD